VSIGICVKYRDKSREEAYRPDLAQRHLTDCLWPLESVHGLERVELLEVLSDYESADNVRALLVELKTVCRFFDDPASAKDRYPYWEHVQTRTAELVQYLHQLLAEWPDIEEVSFF
jgi:hypothetical protein